MAQSVKHPTLDFGSGRDLTVGETEPRNGISTDSTEPGGILSLSLAFHPSLALARAQVLSLSISLKINKLKK